MGEFCNREVVIARRNESALQGVLGLDDVVDLVAEQLNDLVKLIGREQQKESRRRSHAP